MTSLLNVTPPTLGCTVQQVLNRWRQMDETGIGRLPRMRLVGWSPCHGMKFDYRHGRLTRLFDPDQETGRPATARDASMSEKDIIVDALSKGEFQIQTEPSPGLTGMLKTPTFVTEHLHRATGRSIPLSTASVLLEW